MVFAGQILSSEHAGVIEFVYWKTKRTSLPITLPETNSKMCLNIGQPSMFRCAVSFRRVILIEDLKSSRPILDFYYCSTLANSSCEVPMKIQVLPLRYEEHKSQYLPVKEGRNKCTTNITTIYLIKEHK